MGEATKKAQSRRNGIVHVFPVYTSRGGSSRVRMYQFLAPLADQSKIQFKVHPLLPENYLELMYRWRVDGSLFAFIRCVVVAFWGYVNRLILLCALPRYSAVWVEKEFFPNLPPFALWILKLKKARYMVDYDDAVYTRYQKRPLSLFGLRNKISHVMKGADVVVVGNDELSRYAIESGAKKVVILPSVVPMDKFEERANSLVKKPSPVVIGWIGTPLTAFKHLATIHEALRQVSRENEVVLWTVGAGEVELDGVNLQVYPWSEETEIDLLNQMDIGIMPMPEGSFERGKCGYKLIQYMAAGKPVIASPVGVNKKIVRSGSNGFLANSHLEWIEAFQELIADPRLRCRMGDAGRKIVSSQYSVECNVPELSRQLKELVNFAEQFIK